MSNVSDIAYERRRRKIRELTGMSGTAWARDIDARDVASKLEMLSVIIRDGNQEYIYTEEELSLDRFNK